MGRLSYFYMLSAWCCRLTIKDVNTSFEKRRSLIFELALDITRAYNIARLCL